MQLLCGQDSSGSLLGALSGFFGSKDREKVKPCDFSNHVFKKGWFIHLLLGMAL
jgi:hypothetical protein